MIKTKTPREVGHERGERDLFLQYDDVVSRHSHYAQVYGEELSGEIHHE